MSYRLDLRTAAALSVAVALAATTLLPTPSGAQVLRRPPSGATIAAPTGTTAPTRLTAPPPGPAPTIWEVKGFGVTATLSWGGMTDAASYAVTRTLPAKPDCCTASSGPLTKTTWADTTLLVPGDYVYRVYVNYTDGRQGYADVTYRRPPAQDPTGFTATAAGAGQVTLRWNPVAGIASYIVRGPGTAANGTPVNGSALTLSALPLSRAAQEWTVASWYGSAGVLTDAASWPRASAEVSAFGPVSPALWVERSAVTLDFTFPVVHDAAGFQLAQVDVNNQTTQPAFTVASRISRGTYDDVTIRTFPQLTPDRPYVYRVYATMSDGQSYSSAPMTVMIPFFQVRTTIPISNDRIVLEWGSFGSPPYIIKKGVPTQQGGASALVFEEVRDQAGNVLQISGRQYQDMMVQRGVQYSYQVCATVSSGKLCPGVEAALP
jgi:hypothetical protein